MRRSAGDIAWERLGTVQAVASPGLAETTTYTYLAFPSSSRAGTQALIRGDL